MKKLTGTSIIEIVIATALISVSIIAALSLMNRSQKQNTYARQLAEATKYATQASDWIKTERNILGWATMASLPDGTYCLNVLPVDFTEIISGECDATDYIDSTNFQRQIEILKTSDPVNNLDAVKITIKVSWMENVKRQAIIEMELNTW